MQYRKEKLTILGRLIIFLVLFSFITIENSTPVYATPQNLTTALQNLTTPVKRKKLPKVKKGAVPVASDSTGTPVTPPQLVLHALPPEYHVYFEAKNVLEHQADLATIESIEHQVLASRFDQESKVLEHDFDDYFAALEIRRAEKYAKKKLWAPAYRSFNRGLNGMSAFKWIYYWNADSSDALASVCNHNLVKKDDLCLLLAKRVVDAFPKAAEETAILRDLPSADGNAPSDVTGDRLSQNYTEKTEKDEEAFNEILELHLKGEESDFIKRAKQYLLDFPKSIVRYRALFLLGEDEFKKGHQKEANEYYSQIVNDIPLSFYAIVASERMGKPMRDLVKKDPIQIETEGLNLGPNEKIILARAEYLYQKKHLEEVGLELDSLSRVRVYNTDTLLYLMGLATSANQNLSAFRFANEFIQRKYAGLLQNDFLPFIFPIRFEAEIQEQAAANKIDPLLVMSLMKQESGFKAPILSSSGALGLMQLMPFTAIDTDKDLKLARLKEPRVNITVGTKYFGSLLDKYSGNPVYALAAYNAGPHRVSKWQKEAQPGWSMIDFIESIPYKETREYVMAILRNRYWYQYEKHLPLTSVFVGWKAEIRPEVSPSPVVAPPPVTPVPSAITTPSAMPTSSPVLSPAPR